jgi:predicted  nucleic acid-binding Zn-ribbon protein
MSDMYTARDWQEVTAKLEANLATVTKERDRFLEDYVRAVTELTEEAIQHGQAHLELTEARARVIQLNEAMDVQWRAHEKQLTEARAALRESEKRLTDELIEARAEIQRLKAAVELGIEALPDGEKYQYLWNECSTDEQEYVKDVRGKLQTAIGRED